MIALYVLAVLVVAFLASGVLPRYIATKARRIRVETFDKAYNEWADLHERDYVMSSSYYVDPVRDERENEPVDERRMAELRAFLVARRTTMQRDAQAVGKGVMYIAPPPMIGGNYQPHSYFADLFDEQTNSVGSTSVRRDDLATIVHETRRQERRRRADLRNPWAWLRLTFERIVGLPAYVLRVAGFGASVTGSAPVKVSGVIVALATVGAFVVGVLTLLNDLGVF